MVFVHFPLFQHLYKRTLPPFSNNNDSGPSINSEETKISTTRLPP